MALSKKLAKEISRHINGMSCYEILARSALESKEYDKFRNAVKWYNDEADALIAMGIEVVKYSSSQLLSASAGK